MAVQAAVETFQATGTNPVPAAPQSPLQLQQQQRYMLLWGYYRNTVFARTEPFWNQYRQRHRLYNRIRPLYNPTRRLVDFYAGAVYPGVLSIDGSELPDDVQLAIPLADSTDDKIKQAIAQYWQWANWQVGKTLMVRYGGICGNVLTEMIDDVERGKVTANNVRPEHVVYVRLDASGNVKAYKLLYQALDERGSTFEYSKEVNETETRHYRNGQLFGDAIENHYGFVPAVWTKHVDLGDEYGAPALREEHPVKLNELNHLVSRLHDQIITVIKSPQVLATSGNVVPLFAKSTSNGQTGNNEYAQGDYQFGQDEEAKVMMMKAPPDTSILKLAGNVELGQAILYIDHLLGEVERDYPELSMYSHLRTMSHVTGPGADRLMGDVKNAVLDVAANYDQQSIKLFQMALAIGGERIRRGDWRNLTEQQKKFAPFDLSSYSKGQLDFAIMPRPLVPLSPEEGIDLSQKRATLATTIGPDVSRAERLRIQNYSEEDIARIDTEMAAQPAPVVSSLTMSGQNNNQPPVNP